MQSRDPQPMAMQQHGGRIKIAPREPDAAPVPAQRPEMPAAERTSHAEQLREFC